MGCLSSPWFPLVLLWLGFHLLVGTAATPGNRRTVGTRLPASGPAPDGSDSVASGARHLQQVDGEPWPLPQVQQPGWASCNVPALGPFTSIVEAVTKLNLTRLVSLLQMAELVGLLSDGQWNVSFLAPTDAAFQQVPIDFPTANFPGAGSWKPGLPLRDLEAAQALTAMHMFPGRQRLQQLGGAAAGTTIISPTWFTKFEVPSALVVSEVTLQALGQGAVYVGGIAPGVIVNVTCQLTAGNASLYLVDTVLIPPSLSLVHQRGRSALTALDAMALAPNASYALELVMADAALEALLNETSYLATVFVPTDDAFSELFARMGTSLEAAKGTDMARRIIQNHVLPGPPLLLRTAPEGSSAGLRTYSPIAGDVLTLTRIPPPAGSSAPPQLTVQGAGNDAPIPIAPSNDPFSANRTADIRAGKCTMFIISGVILPAGALQGPPAFPQVSSTSPASAFPLAAAISSRPTSCLTAWSLLAGLLMIIALL